MIYRFGDIEIDAAGYRLRRGGEPVAIEPLVFDLLLHFLRHPGRVFSRDELIAAVWSGRVVSDATVSGAIKNLRKALGDSGGARKYIKTLHGRGFRFDAELQTTEAAAAPPQGVNSPAAWGTRAFTETHFAAGASHIELRSRLFSFRYQSAQHWLDLFRDYYGPVHKAFEALDAARREELARDILNLIESFNKARDGTMLAPSEYLEIVITRA